MRASRHLRQLHHERLYLPVQLCEQQLLLQRRRLRRLRPQQTLTCPPRVPGPVCACALLLLSVGMTVLLCHAAGDTAARISSLEAVRAGRGACDSACCKTGLPPPCKLTEVEPQALAEERTGRAAERSVMFAQARHVSLALCILVVRACVTWRRGQVAELNARLSEQRRAAAMDVRARGSAFASCAHISGCVRFNAICAGGSRQCARGSRKGGSSRRGGGETGLWCCDVCASVRGCLLDSVAV